MPRGPVFGRRNRSQAAVAEQLDSVCERCHGGDDEARCRCDAVDRCSEVDGKGHQCILGAGHTLKHANATGGFWQ